VKKLAAILVLVLAGCAGSGGWEKEGASPDTATRDLSQCRSEASRAVARDAAIDQDILASRGQDLQRSGMLTLRRDTMQNSNAGRYQEILDRCMIGRGYHAARD
jgi:hypothetical protein